MALSYIGRQNTARLCNITRRTAQRQLPLPSTTTTAANCPVLRLYPLSSHFSTMAAARFPHDDQDATLEWVPAAYRGVSSSKNFRQQRRETRRPSDHGDKNRVSSNINSRKKSNYNISNNISNNSSNNSSNTKIRRKQPASRNRISAARNREEVQLRLAKSKEKAAVEADFQRLKDITTEMQQILTDYHSALDPLSNISNKETIIMKLSTDAPPFARTKAIKLFLRSLSRQLEVLKTIQSTPPHCLDESEDLFRSLCCVLQDTAKLCCISYKHESQLSQVEFIDCAQTCLAFLQDLRTHRVTLYDNRNANEAFSETREVSPPDTSWFAPFSAVASFVSETVSKITSKVSSAKKVEKPLPAHEDATLLPSKDLVRMIVENIAEASTNDQVEFRSPEKQAIKLFNVLPDEVKLEPRTVLILLEILCHAGTREAARASHRLFTLYANELPHLPFTIVLRSYVEAIKRTTSPERKVEIVKEVIDVFKERWQVAFPRHSLEQIAQASGVLHCIAESGTSTDPQIREEADNIVRWALGNNYEAFMNSYKASENGPGIVDQHIPLANFLARVYATAGSKESVDAARLIVQSMAMRSKEKKDNARHARFPSIETINTVLKACLSTLDPKTPPAGDVSLIVFALSMTDFCLPYHAPVVKASERTLELLTETFELLMDFYTMLQPNWTGKRMEDLISRYETLMYFYKREYVNVSLATYHRVLQGYCIQAGNTAKTSSASKAWALVKKLEMLSTPLFLTPKQISDGTGFKIYHSDLKPNVETYELVLAVCAKCGATAEHEMAAEVACLAADRLFQMGAIQQETIQTFKTCSERIQEESRLAETMKTMLVQMEQAVVERKTSTKQQRKGTISK